MQGDTSAELYVLQKYSVQKVSRLTSYAFQVRIYLPTHYHFIIYLDVKKLFICVLNFKIEEIKTSNSIVSSHLYIYIYIYIYIYVIKKISVYEMCVLSILLYSSETWTTYRQHIKTLERFHQTCFRKILNIRGQSFTSDITVLQHANVPSIIRNHMHWTGHLVRIHSGGRLLKQLFYWELQCGKRPWHKPKKRFKDAIKTT